MKTSRSQSEGALRTVINRRSQTFARRKEPTDMFPGHPTIHHIVVDTRLYDAYRAAEHARRVAEARAVADPTSRRPGVVRRALGDMLVRIGERIQGSRRTEGAEASNPSLGTLHIAR